MPKAVLIDDEPPARATLRQLLTPHPEVQVVGEAGMLVEARQLLARDDYDLVFLDVQLRGGTGFDLVPLVRERARIIFVTGFDTHAVRAFEANALDYLVKPLQPARLSEALRRVTTLAPVPPEPMQPVVSALAPGDTAYVKTGPGAMRFLPLHSIVTIGSADNYSEVQLANGERVLTRQTLAAWEALLPVSHFMRVQRTIIVNLARIEGIAHEDRDRTLLRVADRRDPVPSRREDWPLLRARLFALRPGNLPPE
jgi:two-component system LytT family response regulator